MKILPKYLALDKKTANYYIKILEKGQNIVPLEKYKNSKTNIKHKCLSCSYIWSPRPSNILTGNKCPKCQRKNRGIKSRISNDDYVSRLLNINQKVLPIDDYVSMKEKIKHLCVICNEEFYISPENTLRGYGHKKCYPKNIAPNTMSSEEYRLKVFKNNPNIIILSDYYPNIPFIEYECKECGYIGKVSDHCQLYHSNCLNCSIIKSRKKHEEYVNELKNNNINLIPIEEYNGSHIAILHKCTNGHEIKMMPTNVLKGHGCKICKTISKTKTHEQYVNELKEKNSLVELLDNYNGTQKEKKNLFKCLICGYKWYTNPSLPLSGKGCPICKNDKISKKLQLSHDEFLDRVKNNNSLVNILGLYCGEKNTIKVECVVCGNIWNGNSLSIMQGSSGCPVCSYSKGEIIIQKFFDINNINYIKQKKFDELFGIGNRKLSYDFYLPNYNILIEFQGKQHEEPIDYFGGEEQFKIQQEHDKRKRDYAIENNIELLEIWYYDINNIENTLKEKLNLESVETVISA